MIDFAGRTAFITGAASGMGLAFARRLGAAGAQVVIADVEAGALATAEADLRAEGIAVLAVRCDVSDYDAVAAARDAAIAAFGNVHFLFNNAGVSRGGALETIDLADWAWVMGVNLMGVVHGLRAFLPHMKGHGEPGHIVNTASMSGLRATAQAGLYVASKHAVVGLTEVLALELEGTALSVSMLCPSFVRTNMQSSGRNRPDAAGGVIDLSDDPRVKRLLELTREGLPPEEVAELVVRAMEAKQLYIMTHPEQRHQLDKRFGGILADMSADEARLADIRGG